MQFLLQLGRLTGNADMHLSNISLFAAGAKLSDIAKCRFRLAPVYDMLPMCWRPDPTTGSLDYSPFTSDDRLADTTVRLAAHEFWTVLAGHPSVRASMQVVVGEMAGRVRIRRCKSRHGCARKAACRALQSRDLALIGQPPCARTVRGRQINRGEREGPFQRQPERQTPGCPFFR